jgi:hypothetical protein
VQFNDRTSKKSNPSLLEVDITFDSKTNRIIGFTPLLAEGCFQSDGPTSSKSSCKCTIDDEILQCKSIGYRSDTGWKNEASFFVNRWTGKMSTIVNITDNADLVYGWTGFDLRCNKVDSAKF